MHYNVQLHFTLYHKYKDSVTQKAAQEEDLKKSEMETYKETTKIARNMLVLSI